MDISALIDNYILVGTEHSVDQNRSICYTVYIIKREALSTFV